MMGVLLEDVPFEDLSHIECVEPETEGLGRDRTFVNLGSLIVGN